MSARRRFIIDAAGITPMAVIGLLVAVSALLMVSDRIQPIAIGQCLTLSGPPPTQPLPPVPDWWRWVLLGGSVLAFAAGHVTSHLRHRVELASGMDSSRTGSRLVQAMIVTFLAAGVLLAVYETLSVVPDRASPSFWPISYYVRCANDVAHYPTLAAVVVVAFLLGHWFCHPGTQPERSERREH